MKTNSFKAFCDKAKKVLGKNTLPILDYVKIKDGTITATNLEITIVQKIEGLGEIGEGLILFDNLVKIVDKLSNVDISISFYSEGEEKKKNFFVKIDSKKGTFKFSTCNPDDYVKTFVCEDKFDTLSIEDVNIVKALNKYTDIKRDDARYHHVWVDKSHIVGTNGNILKFQKRDSEHSDKLMIHTSVINLMDNTAYDILCGTLNSGVIKYLKLVDCNNNFELIFKMSDLKVPNWEAIIPQKEKCSSNLFLSSKQIRELLDASSLVVNKYYSLIVFENNPDEEEFTLSCEDIDYGSSFSETLCFIKNKGLPIKIGVNHKLLSHIIKIEGATIYEFNFTDPKHAILLNDNILLFPIILS